MKVLWFSPTPSMYDEQKIGGWVSSLENAFREFEIDIEIGIAFEYPTKAEKKIQGNITYYPVQLYNSKTETIYGKLNYEYRWQSLLPKYLNIVDDFNPDLIQCFGSEWEYGLIAKSVNVPVVIHMQGFFNIQNYCTEIVNRGLESGITSELNIISKAIRQRNKNKRDYKSKQEIEVMKINKFFLGRTEWDKNIVRFYSPNSNYFYCSEVIRPSIYNSNMCWALHDRKKCVLVTITQGGPVKGNEILLRTAKILKDTFNFDFTWRVAGNISNIKRYEKLGHTRFCENNVELLGLISEEDVKKEILNADIFINTSINDNSPNSICEAQVLGCPVISTNVGGISSIIEDGKSGLLYPYDEPHTLAFKIMKLFNNDELMNFLSTNERNIAIDRHNPRKIVKKLTDIYEKILKEKNEGEKE